MHTSRPIDHLCTVRLAPPIKNVSISLCAYKDYIISGYYMRLRLILHILIPLSHLYKIVNK